MNRHTDATGSFATARVPPRPGPAGARRFGMRSIRHKLSIGILLITLSTLLIAGVTILVYDLGDYRERVFQDLRTQADLIGQASVAALQFDDLEVADKTLRLLRLRPQILAASIHKPGGQLFADYSTVHGQHKVTQPPGDTGFHVAGDTATLCRPIRFNQDPLGAICLLSEYQLQSRLLRDIGIVAGVAVLALAVAALLSRWIQARVTRPVLQVTDLARRVVDRRDYSLRAASTTDDEIGFLVEAFNDMLSEIGNRTAALESSNRRLEAEIRERTEAEQALRDSEQRHRTLVTELTAVVWRADAAGDFLDDQPGWDAFTGQTPGSHIGQGWLDAFIEQDRPALEQQWQQARQTATPFAAEARLWHADSGLYRHVSLRSVPLRDSSGQVIEWMGIIDDIHDRVQASEEIHRLNAELEQRVQERTAELENANRELEAFSYSVSHDLRAPLRSIDGFSQALLEDCLDALDETGRDYLGRVRAAAQRMGVLIDDLLKLSRVSRVELEREGLDLSAMAAEIVANLRESEPDRTADVQITAGLNAQGDARLIKVALENLLGNAWKYSGRRPRTRIEFGMREYRGNPCYFVQDNGAGFDMTYADRLFGAFQRLHDAREYPGTGIGLATVQRIIRRHGGQVWAEAEVDKGAAFYFTLPSARESGGTT